MQHKQKIKKNWFVFASNNVYENWNKSKIKSDKLVKLKELVGWDK